MQKILRKRIFRDLKENLSRYLALGFMIVLGMFIVISLVAAADTIIKGTEDAAKEQSIEDGQFYLFAPLTAAEQKKLEDAGITIEEHFYLDHEMADDAVLRVFSVRQEIDRAQADIGRLPEQDGEILLEKRYCQEHGISVDDKIQIGGDTFTVCGIGTSPDYEGLFRKLSDSIADSQQFGIGFVSEADYKRLKEKENSIQSEEYAYAYLLNDKLTDKELKEMLQGFAMSADEIKFSKLTQFLPAADNVRIGAAADDVFINKAAGLFVGVLLIVLFAYVISVFVVHTIERESEVIGTLYALGVKRKELLFHYLLLPVAITFVAGVIGTLLGYSSFGVNAMMKDTYAYFSVPELAVVREPYLLIYGIIMPPAAAAITNFLVIRRKLKKPALTLIRREQRAVKIKNVRLRGKSFVRIYQIRQFIRERRTAFTVFFGMLFSLLICMICLNCYVFCEHVRTDTVEDTKYEYMYTYKYPEETVPKEGEEAYGVNLKKEVLGYNLDVTLLGIHPDNPYFDAPVEEGQSRALVSSAMANKYALKAGDELVLNDSENDRSYAFTIDGIVPYSAGLLVFMDIDSMRELMGKSEDYYNVVFSDHALDMDAGRLYATASKAEVKKSASVFVELMWSMIVMLSVASALIFIVVMYLMLKVMIDRSGASISMLKIFGYRKKEIRKLYLNGNLIIVAVSALIGIPLSKVLMDAVFPYLVSNVSAEINLTFDWQMYAGLFAAIIVLYLVITPLLMRRINRILPAEVLKNRE